MIVNKDIIYQNISMKKFNSWKVGGNAENYIEVSSELTLQEVLEQKKIKLPITVIGLGSNVLIRDGGLKGTVINLSRGDWSRFKRFNKRWRVKGDSNKFIKRNEGHKK